jgi:hypothetical protein
MQSKVKRQWWALVFLGLGGCLLGPDACNPVQSEQDYPNGKRGVLFFERGDAEELAYGLETDIRLVKSFEFGQPPSVTLDFEGTTLEAEADAGLSVTAVRREGEGHLVTVRCEPLEEPRRTVELRVKVHAADGRERYADALDVECARATRLEVQGLVGQGVTVGQPIYALRNGRLLLQPRPVALFDDGGGKRLGGRGELRLEDPQGVARRVEGSQPVDVWRKGAEVELVRAGSGLAVRFAGLETPLPLQVVEESEVRFEVDLHKDASGRPNVATGRAVLLSNGAVVEQGLGLCEVEHRPANGSPSVHPPGACSLPLDSAPGSGTVCVRVPSRGWSACAEYTR